jgi:hypothetical protein
MWLLLSCLLLTCWYAVEGASYKDLAAITCDLSAFPTVSAARLRKYSRQRSSAAAMTFHHNKYQHLLGAVVR